MNTKPQTFLNLQQQEAEQQWPGREGGKAGGITTWAPVIVSQAHTQNRKHQAAGFGSSVHRGILNPQGTKESKQTEIRVHALPLFCRSG